MMGITGSGIEPLPLGDFFWCKRHERQATHRGPEGRAMCDPALGGMDGACWCYQPAWKEGEEAPECRAVCESCKYVLEDEAPIAHPCPICAGEVTFTLPAGMTPADVQFPVEATAGEARELVLEAMKTKMPDEDSPWFSLWKFFADQHGIELLESELGEIVLEVDKYRRKIPDPGACTFSVVGGKLMSVRELIERYEAAVLSNGEMSMKVIDKIASPPDELADLRRRHENTKRRVAELEERTASLEKWTHPEKDVRTLIEEQMDLRSAALQSEAFDKGYAAGQADGEPAKFSGLDFATGIVFAIVAALAAWAFYLFVR